MSGKRLQTLLVMLSMVFGMLWMTKPAQAQRAPRPAPWSKDRQKSDPKDLEISLVTFSPGDDVPSWFGHSAIVVWDKTLRTRRLYNYGMFRFDSLMVARFVKGRLLFWVGPSSYSRTLNLYKRYDRDVHIQVLNVEPDKAREIAEYLEWNVKLENREYLYHHYDDNCSTRLRDLIDMATSGQFKKWATSTPARMTLRGHTRRHAAWRTIDFGMMFAMNSDIDKPIHVWEEMFLPGELEAQIDKFSYVNSKGEKVPLVKKKTVWYKAKDRKPPGEEPNLLWPIMLIIGLVFGGVSALLARRHHQQPDARGRRIAFGLWQMFTGFCFGMAGVLLLLMWTVTDHVIAYHNENLLWVSPLFILGVVFGFGVARNKPKARARLAKLWYICAGSAVLGLVLKVTPWFSQHNVLTIVMMVPLLIGLVVTARTLQSMDAA